MINNITKIFTGGKEPNMSSVLVVDKEDDDNFIVKHSTVSAYNRVDLVRTSVDFIINSCMRVPFEIEDRNRRDDNIDRKVSRQVRNIDRVLNISPNPIEDRTVFFKEAFLDLIIHGNAFINVDKESLYRLPAARVEIVPDKDRKVKMYKFKPNISLVEGPYSGNDYIEFTPEEIIHIQDPTLGDVLKGTSRVQQILPNIDLYVSMKKFQFNFFRNNAVPGVVLTSPNTLSKEVRDRILESWRNLYSAASRGSRSPAVLDGGLAIDKFSSMNFRELDFGKSIDIIKEDIVAFIGVPYILLNSGNNANLPNNEKRFYTHTVLPILEAFSTAFSHYFDDKVIIRPNLFSIEALQPELKDRITYHAGLVNAGIITPNEAREGLNYPKIDDPAMDEIREPVNITGSAVNPLEGGKPSENNDDG